MSALTNLAPAVPVADNLLAARELMAFTLGFHIILACVGVALPAMMLIAEFKGRRNDDDVALDLAVRWSKAAAVLFAVGAVTGTVLSFEMGLLWPRFMERFGDVFGTGFAIEGIFFFTEAIFIAIYIYGWKRIAGWKHWWTGVPIFIAGIGGAFSVVAVNSWMNQPQGFKLDSAGNPTDVEPLNALFNPATTYEVPHMLLAAYLVVGFGLASVYAIGMLRKPERRHDRRYRLGLLIPLSVAAILTPVQLFVGDVAARGVADHQPSKFAGFECIEKTGPDQTEWLGGICTDDGVKYGIGIPGLDSLLVGFSTDTVVTGLDQIPDDEEPPANTMLHLAFDAMVGIGFALLALGAWLGFAWWRKRDIPATKWFLRAVALSGIGAVVAMEAGWVVTEVGRQPWIVYEVMRTEDAVTGAGGLWFAFGGAVVLYAAIGTVAVFALRRIARREDPGADIGAGGPYGPPPSAAEPKEEAAR
ncbi:MAG TPA: cytochrome ubiquinol oxidase subunit I [Solirubrobacterales bacterium]|nr:cytochrome ubiquinol oxidase subunit I [Solirubrobacterales bacterium]